MRRMIMKLPLIIQNSVVRMVQLQQVLQRAGRLLLRVLDFEALDGRDLEYPLFARERVQRF